MISIKNIFIFLIAITVLVSCKNNKNKLFILRESKETGIDFANRLSSTPSLNMLKYMYFYNGAGCGAGDFNKDGKIDLFFASNQQQNKLYLNEGEMKFKDVTSSAGIPNDGGWSTGVNVCDINQDGLLDIYVCRVGQFETLKGKNQLLICVGIDKNGIPHYTEKAAQYGLDFSGFSTQSACIDYDVDGDMDFFLLNHSVHQNGTFAERSNFLGTRHPLSGDRLFRNDGGWFTDVTDSSGINSNAIGYGLGICIADINMDGYPDIYIGNDFHENDYLYINNKNGKFIDQGAEKMQHTSQFSMGVDVADLNNDAFPEIISMDMLPEDPYILKRSLGEDEYNTFHMKIGYGYHYQFTRNNLQWNRKDGNFSEVGLYSGIAATDWSWASLFVDFNNDGKKDVFISNGIPKRLNDIDYVNYISNEELQKKMDAGNMNDQDFAVIDKFPQIKLPNKFYYNNGDLAFTDQKENIGNNLPTFSNGALYADLDNDGDQDIVVNNIDDPVMIYENQHEQQVAKDSQKQWMNLSLLGSPENKNAIGAKVIVYQKEEILTYENYPVHGFLSSMQVPLHVSWGKVMPDSLLLIWPDHSYQKITAKPGALSEMIAYKKGLKFFDYSVLQKNNLHTPQLIDVSEASGLKWVHKENAFNEFDRELLIPHMTSREGPALAVADVNGDGFEDVFIGSSKGEKPALFLQQFNAQFIKWPTPELDADSTFEEVSAIWEDLNNDKHPDLILASGGNEYYGHSEYLRPRVFINDGKGNLSKNKNAFGELYVNASVVVAMDINKDGHKDLFVGGRTIPFEYGAMPESYLLQNDGKGNFINVTEKVAPALKNIGMVTGSTLADINNDRVNDLVLCLEWGNVVGFVQDNKTWKKIDIGTEKGWWNTIQQTDIDADGDMDFVVGNLGLNSRLKANAEEPLRLYYNDFDDNGKHEQILSYYLQHKEIPFPNKDELQRQLPSLKKKYLYAENLAKAEIKEIFGTEKLNASLIWEANELRSMVYVNQGNQKFTPMPLPWQAQLSPIKSLLPNDINGDGKMDLIAVGNYFENNIEMGRYDADYGTILLNNGNQRFSAEQMNGIALNGECRNIKSIRLSNGSESWVVAVNNSNLKLIKKK